ncbi:MAG: hypothetical protein KAH07_00755 [Flavobacteriaceae bacterium]|nr:hypothetical protein [Flavobacteriaceae bacterium]
MKKITLTIVVLFTVLNSLAQKDSTEVRSIKPLRVGIKMGIPSLITLNAEYVTPLLNNRVAFFGDYMTFSKTIEAESGNYTNYELGTNIYLDSEGEGLYFAISYFSFDSNAVVEDVDFTDEYGNDYEETAPGSLKFNTINLKVGAKFGSEFYCRVEAGYGFGNVPEGAIFTSSSGDIYIEKNPISAGFGLPILNFGIGFSFL